MAKQKDPHFPGGKRKGEAYVEGRKTSPYRYRYTVIEDGKKVRRDLNASNLNDLRNKEAELFERLREEEETNKNQLRQLEEQKKTLNGVYELWLERKEGLKDHTRQNYVYMYEHFVAPEFGKKDITTIRPSDVDKFYLNLRDVKHIQISTIDSIHTVLHQVLKFARRDNLITFNPSDDALTELKRAMVKEQTPGEGRREALTVKQQNLLESHLKETKSPWEPLVKLMLYTGLRVGELTGLRWQDIKTDENGGQYIHVQNTLVYYDHHDEKKDMCKCRYEVTTVKTKAGNRRIPLTAEAKQALHELKKQRLARPCVDTISGYDNFIIANRFGHVMNRDSLNRALKRIQRDIFVELVEKGKGADAIPPFTCHTMRHTFATRFIEKSNDYKSLQVLLGHSDLATTMDIYAEAKYEHNVDKINLISKAVSE